MTWLAALCLAAAMSATLVLLLAARSFGWRSRQIAILVRPWLIAIWIVLTVGLSAAAASRMTKFNLVEWVLVGSWLAASLLVHVVGRRRKRASHAFRRWGAKVAHIGVAIAVGGILLSWALTTKAERLMEPGDTVRFASWAVQLHEVWPTAGEGWAGVTAELRASSGNGVVLLGPQLRSDDRHLQGSVSATVARGAGRLTASVGARDADGRWPIRLRITPLIVLIPLGGMIAAFGGAMAMVGPPLARWRRLRRARLSTAWWA